MVEDLAAPGGPVSRGRSSSWSSTSRVGPVRRCSFMLRGLLRCAWCRRDPTKPERMPGRDLELDHVLARAVGGGVQAWNLVPACSGCNLCRDCGGLEERLRALGLSYAAGLAEVSRQLALPLDVRAGRSLARVWYASWFDAYREEQRLAWHRRKARRLQETEVALLDGLGGDAFPFGELAEPEPLAAE